MKHAFSILVLAGGLLFAGSCAAEAAAPVAAASFVQSAPHAAPRADLLIQAGDKRSSGPDHHARDWQKKRERMMERIDKLPPEQQEKARKRLEEMRARREQIRAELEALPPEEREARMEELRQQYQANREEHREAFRREFQQRWEDASPEEREAFCDRAQERCDDGGLTACDFVNDACGNAE